MTGTEDAVSLSDCSRLPRRLWSIISYVLILTRVKVRNHGLVLRSDAHPSSTWAHKHSSELGQLEGEAEQSSCNVTVATHHGPRRCWSLNFLLPSSWWCWSHYRTSSSCRCSPLPRGSRCRCWPGLGPASSPEPPSSSPASSASGGLSRLRLALSLLAFLPEPKQPSGLSESRGSPKSSGTDNRDHERSHASRRRAAQTTSSNNYREPVPESDPGERSMWGWSIWEENLSGISAAITGRPQQCLYRACSSHTTSLCSEKNQNAHINTVPSNKKKKIKHNIQSEELIGHEIIRGLTWKYLSFNEILKKKKKIHITIMLLKQFGVWLLEPKLQQIQTHFHFISTF